MTVDLAAPDFDLAITHDLCDESCVSSTISNLFQSQPVWGLSCRNCKTKMGDDDKRHRWALYCNAFCSDVNPIQGIVLGNLAMAFLSKSQQLAAGRNGEGVTFKPITNDLSSFIALSFTKITCHVTVIPIWIIY